MQVIDNSSKLPALKNDDYEGFFYSELMKFQNSDIWNKKYTDFLRLLATNVPANDIDLLLSYLRNYRQECLKQFEKTKYYMIWSLCFNRDQNSFDKRKFIQKLDALYEGSIDQQDLYDFFIYFCLTTTIDNLINRVLTAEKSNRGNVTFQVYVNEANICFSEKERCKNDGEEENNNGSELDLENQIFNSLIFDNYHRLNLLHKTIGHFIDQGDDNIIFGEPLHMDRINPESRNEWYYIMAALIESNIVKKNLSVPAFINQMISWYPNLFDFIQSKEDLESYKRRMSKSISAERNLWKYGPKKEVSRL